MTGNTTVLITDMAILVAIFAMGLLAKLFPRNKEQGTGNRDQKAARH